MRRKQGFYSFCMCQHERLGAASPARHLTTVVLKIIFDHFKSASGLELEVTKHSVHRVRAPGDYVVSNLRKFSLEAVLFYPSSRRPAEHSLWLRCIVLCEDGSVVTSCSKCTAGCDGCQLTGDTEAVAMDGTATFREIKMGKLLLSARYGGKRFRIRVEPKEAEVRAAYPRLFVHSEPFRVVTKLPAPPPVGMPEQQTIPPPLAGSKQPLLLPPPGPSQQLGQPLVPPRSMPPALSTPLPHLQLYPVTAGALTSGHSRQLNQPQLDALQQQLNPVPQAQHRPTEPLPPRQQQLVLLPPLPSQHTLQHQQMAPLPVQPPTQPEDGMLTAGAGDSKGAAQQGAATQAEFRQMLPSHSGKCSFDDPI